MGSDSGRVALEMDFEMRTFRTHFGIAIHISFDAPETGNLMPGVEGSLADIHCQCRCNFDPARLECVQLAK